jgi:hypothetical protein
VNVPRANVLLFGHSASQSCLNPPLPQREVF